MLDTIRFWYPWETTEDAACLVFFHIANLIFLGLLGWIDPHVSSDRLWYGQEVDRGNYAVFVSGPWNSLLITIVRVFHIHVNLEGREPHFADKLEFPKHITSVIPQHMRNDSLSNDVPILYQ